MPISLELPYVDALPAWSGRRFTNDFVAEKLGVTDQQFPWVRAMDEIAQACQRGP